MKMNPENFFHGYEESVLQMFFREFMEERKSKIQKASSREYIEWLYEYVHRSPVSDEDYFDEEDKNGENASILSYFYEYIRMVAIRQRVMEVYLTKEEFPTNELIIRIKDRYFRIQRIVGQGAMTWVQECEKPDFSYVVISEKEEELYEDWCDWSPAE